MKRRIITLLCIVAMAALALASCDESGAAGGGHTHTYSSAWSSNDTEHWHPATCEHGENKGDLAPHADADEDGVCDACQYEVGHTHAYASEWSSDENNHWKAATCTHAAEKGELSLHADDDLDGECDVCEKHVHILSYSGLCKACGDQVKPMDENNLGAVIAAVGEHNGNIVGGQVDYEYVGNSKSYIGTDEERIVRAHTVEYLIGKNGTYSKSTYSAEILEKFIKIVSADEVEGISVTSDLDGKVTNAEPSSFGTDDLAGYYFAVSTLADGHGPEAVLMSLYEVMNNATKIENYQEIHSAELNTYKFSYNALIVQETTIAVGNNVGSKVYNANYYFVDVSFTYTDNYELSALKIVCDCWTNDAGENTEADIDFTYTPETGIVWEDDPWKDTYTFTVGQVVGERTEITLDDGSAYAPTDFDLYTDEACTKKAESVNITLGDNSSQLYIKCLPEGSFISFIKYNFNSSVKDSEGNASNGLQATLTGDVVYLLPVHAGEYVVTLNSGNITKTINVTVTDPGVAGENKIQVVGTTSYEWVDLYEFTVEKSGTYTFYAPYGLGIWLESDLDKGAPKIDPSDPYNDATSFTVTLRKGAIFKFYYLVYSAGVTYTIGYDYTAPTVE